MEDRVVQRPVGEMKPRLLGLHARLEAEAAREIKVPGVVADEIAGGEQKAQAETQHEECDQESAFARCIRLSNCLGRAHGRASTRTGPVQASAYPLPERE